MALYSHLDLLILGSLFHRYIVLALISIVIEPNSALCSRLIPSVHFGDLIKIYALELVLILQPIIFTLQRINIQVIKASRCVTERAIKTIDVIVHSNVNA